MATNKPSFDVMEKESSFPEGFFSFPRDSLSTGKPGGGFIFWLCFRNSAQTCILLEEVKLLSVVLSIFENGDPSLREVLLPLCPESKLHASDAEAQGVIESSYASHRAKKMLKKRALKAFKTPHLGRKNKKKQSWELK